jgi:hypothetical protein
MLTNGPNRGRGEPGSSRALARGNTPFRSIGTGTYVDWRLLESLEQDLDWLRRVRAAHVGLDASCVPEASANAAEREAGKTGAEPDRYL